MAMTLPLSPVSGNSPHSDGEAPHTPISPISQDAPQLEQNNQQLNPSSPSNSGTAQVKRKPSRRANTAERRATHNAVERQRRETLNGRFLDLAALLPNLSQIRRPSKSSIVNSSIAHIHASRRHRMLAARELRMMKQEADALRRELNEWRDRAGIPRIEEPVRGDAFSMVLSGELEVIAAIPGEEEGDEDNDYPGYPDDEYPIAMPGHSLPHGHSHHPGAHHLDEMEDPRMSMMKPGHFQHNMPSGPAGNGLHLAHILPRPSPGGAPMMASPTSFEPNGMYESHNFGGSGPHGPGYMQQQQAMDAEKMVAWYGAQSQQQQQQQQMMQAQRSLFTPPASSHGLPGSNGNNGNGNNVNNGSASPINGNPSNGGNSSNSPSPVTSNAFADPSSQAFYAANMPRQQQGYASDEGSVGSSGTNGKRMSIPIPRGVTSRGRALSTTSHSHSVAMSSSPGASPSSAGAGSPTYEVDGGFGPRANGWRDEVSHHGHLMGMGMGMNNGMMMNGMGIGMANGLVGNGMGQMVSVGGPGGGNGGGFSMMM